MDDTPAIKGPEVCPLRLAVSAKRADGSPGGHACMFTGGFCVPASDCPDRVAEVEREALDAAE